MASGEERDDDTASEEERDGDTASEEERDGDTASEEESDDDTAGEEERDDVMAGEEARPRELLTSLRDLLEDEDFADLKLRLGDGEVFTSRLLVAALSPVFRRMLATPMRERNRGEIVLEHVSKASWNVVVSFYFRGKRLVTANNAEEIAEIACMYNMKSLAYHSSQVLSETVTTDTVFSRLELTNRYDFKDSRTGILRFLGKHFETLSSTEPFNKLPQEDLLEVLDHRLLVTSEDKVCRALLSWLERNQVDEDAADQLFDQVKLPDVSTEYISEHVLYHPQVVSKQTLKNRVAEEFRRRCAARPGIQKMYARPPVLLDNILLLGHDGRGMRVFGSKEPPVEWRELPAIKEVGGYFAACRLGGSVYVTGGKTTMSATFVFDIQRKIWSRGPDLLNERHSHSMIPVGQSLFVVAGHDNDSYLSSIEELLPSKNSWVLVGYLEVATAFCGLAAVNGTIIVAGGVQSELKIQTFDTITNTATILETPLPKSLKIARGTQSQDGAVFLGEDGALVTLKFSAGEISTVEHYQIPGFRQRKMFGLLVDSHVKVFGGGEVRQPHSLGGKTTLTPGVAVERFRLDGKKNEWRAARLPIPLQVSGVFRTALSLQ